MEKLLEGITVPERSKIIVAGKRLLQGDRACVAIYQAGQTLTAVCNYPGKGRLVGTAIEKTGHLPDIVPFEVTFGPVSNPTHLHLQINTRDPHLSKMGSLRVKARYLRHP